jgi:transcriptional regulator with XRE-family HTH domain
MTTQPSLQQIAKILGTKIRQLRKERGWSQSEFAKVCRIHRSHMGKIERGETNVRLSTLVAIAGILETKVEQLLTVAEESRKTWTQ